MDWKDLYHKLKDKKAKVSLGKYSLDGIICGYSSFGLVMAITEGGHGWPISTADESELYINPEYEDNVFGFWYVVDSDVEK